jgi:hypothetical protein
LHLHLHDITIVLLSGFHICALASPCHQGLNALSGISNQPTIAGAIDEDEEGEVAVAAYNKVDQYRLPVIANKAASPLIGKAPPPLPFRPQRQPAESAMPPPTIFGKHYNGAVLSGGAQHQADLVRGWLGVHQRV